MAFARRFVAFWYDFLVGDRWELFLGPIAALLIVWLGVQAGLSALASGLLLFALISAVGALSVGWAIRR